MTNLLLSVKKDLTFLIVWLSRFLWQIRRIILLENFVYLTSHMKWGEGLQKRHNASHWKKRELKIGQKASCDL